jgi:hypothetical protein
VPLKNKRHCAKKQRVFSMVKNFKLGFFSLNQKKNLNTDRNGTSNEEFSLNSLENSKSATVRSRQQKNSEKKMKKVTIMIILVTLNFAIGWMPTHLFIIIRRIRTIDPNTNEYVYLQVFKIVAHTLSYLTPVINVCLYAFFNENFQKPLKEIYLKLVCKYDKNKRLIFNAQANRERSGSLTYAVKAVKTAVV